MDESAGHRHERLQELILEELRGLFRDDVSDPALVSVWIAALVLSVDYRHARVHYTVRVDAGEELRYVEARLLRATPFLRARVGEALDLKRVPDLTFVLDPARPSGEQA
ncbi:MAG TPA: ribosome-binding factor A [Polyangiaceae bacterium]|jgi:ribosome-binding factor A